MKKDSVKYRNVHRDINMDDFKNIGYGYCCPIYKDNEIVDINIYGHKRIINICKDGITKEVEEDVDGEIYSSRAPFTYSEVKAVIDFVNKNKIILD